MEKCLRMMPIVHLQRVIDTCQPARSSVGLLILSHYQVFTDGRLLPTRKPSGYVTNTKINSASVGKSSTGLSGWG